MCNYAITLTIAHCKYRVLTLQVPFFICRYLLLNIQVPFSTRQQAIHGTALFTPDLLTPHTAFASLPATVSVFWNVSTHFFYPCAHSVVALSTRCHLNRRKLNTYRVTRPPSWENGTWQVPSQLSHSVIRSAGRFYFVGALLFCDNLQIHLGALLLGRVLLIGTLRYDRLASNLIRVYHGKFLTSVELARIVMIHKSR